MAKRHVVFSGYLGKAFYFSIMRYSDVTLLLKIFSNEAGNVQVIIPLLGINRTYLLLPSAIDTISISLPRMKDKATRLDNRGIQIVSTVDVAIYAIEMISTRFWGHYVKQLMPVTNSSKVFVLQSYETELNTNSGSRFIIIATEDLTDITIKLRTASPASVTYNNITYIDGDIINITLNRLQTFYAYLNENDLSGSLIESNKPIAVFSGAYCVKIPNFVGVHNDIESQMIPVSHWGYEYIVPPIYLHQCHVRVFAFHNATRISVNAKFDLGSNITLNQGEFWETQLYGFQAQPLVISSDTVVSVVLYGASITSWDKRNGRPFMMVVPDIRQYSASAKTFPTLEIIWKYAYENYAAIVVLEASCNQLRYNGISPDILQTYDVLTNYTVVIISLKNVTIHTISSASSTIPMSVFVFGLGRFDSYGFVAGFVSNNAGNKINMLSLISGAHINFIFTCTAPKKFCITKYMPRF